mgnify:CR=1 FL=1
MWISYSALDTLFFKDGKPFSMGEDSWADGLFPPPPSVFLGALRTALLATNPAMAFKLPQDDPTVGIFIKNIHLAHVDSDSPIFPCPLDFVKRKGEKEFSLLRLSHNEAVTSSVFSHLLENTTNHEIENCPDYFWLTEAAFEEYLNGELPGDPLEFKVLQEPKLGIGRNRQLNAASDGMLYRVGMRRLKDESGNQLLFNVAYGGLSEDMQVILGKQNSGFAKLGAEGKAASTTIYAEAPSRLRLPIFSHEHRVFKIVTATPTIFNHSREGDALDYKDAWIPDFIDRDTFEGDFQGIRVSLLAAAVGKPLSIGGFDMLEGEPKPMVKAVPAGSVFFFKILDADASLSEFSSDLDGTFSFSKERRNEGFGLAYLAKVARQNA